MATLAAFMSALSLEVVVVMEAETTGAWLMEVVVAAEVPTEAEEETGVEALIIMAAESGAADREVIATMGFWALACC